jgi:hypothetical protein
MKFIADLPDPPVLRQAAVSDIGEDLPADDQARGRDGHFGFGAEGPVVHLAFRVDALPQSVHQMEGSTQDLDVPVAVVADPDRSQAEWAIGRRAEDEMLEFDIGGPSVGGHEHSTSGF